MRLVAALASLVLAIAATLSPAQVLRYTVDTDDGQTVLTSVTVDRGSGPLIYNARALIGARLVHFTGNGTNIAEVLGRSAPTAERRARLLDAVLNTGAVNPCGSTVPLKQDLEFGGASPTPGCAVEFDLPVVNRPGVDVVLFEIDKEASGDGFHVGPVKFRDGLKTLTVAGYDIHGRHPLALLIDDFDLYLHASPPNTFELFTSGQVSPKSSNPERGFKALAVGIDLGAIGYRDGETVDRLFFQDDSPGGGFDPVCIVGLPKPTIENLLKSEPVVERKPIEPGEMLRGFLAAGSENGTGTDRPDRSQSHFLGSPAADFDEIVFAQRVSGCDHWYGNFGHYCDDSLYTDRALIKRDGRRFAFGEGARLCRLNLRTGELKVLLDDPLGGIRDPNVHYDGNKILFSYRRGGTEAYHLYEIDADGSHLRQLTDGPDNDIEPIYLPGGGIMFCSSRCHRFVPCWRTQVAVLYRCDSDGKNVRMVSNNAEQENTPWILPDGRVLFMRWEYVDRNQLTFHHLWTVNPDGTGLMVYFGNQDPLDRAALLDAKPIPGTDKTVVSFSPGHGRSEHLGYISIIDPSQGPDASDRLRHISKRSLRDPYPVTENLFLVADDRGIYLMDDRGTVEPVFTPDVRDCGLPVHEPRPLRSRSREPVIPRRGQADESKGYLFLSDIYEGRNMEGVRRGEIAKLLILEQLPKPANFSGGQEPLTIGGTFTLERVLGTVPVEPDGSAYFEVPAVRSVFFVALDENDMAVKRMQSFVTVQPGETTGCVGCHEHRVQAPHDRSVLTLDAMQRPPSRIQPFEGMPDVFDFARDIQPILDRKCVRCHNADRRDGGVELGGDMTPLYTTSYWTMFTDSLVSDGRNGLGNRPPRTIGSSASRLMKLIDGLHYDARLTERERTIIRLWIETGATYPGTYAALGSGMYVVELPQDVVRRRCAECHTAMKPSYRNVKKGAFYYQFGHREPPQPLFTSIQDIILIRHLAYFQPGESRLYQAYCNLSRPDKSLFLRAPLAKEAGGLGLCGKAVFASADDTDYQAIRAAIESAAGQLAEKKRFGMSGFVPNRFYIQEMQNFGILPQPLPPGHEIDVYATDQAYWESCRCRPPKTNNRLQQTQSLQTTLHDFARE